MYLKGLCVEMRLTSLDLSISLSLSLSLFISPPSFSLWFHNTCHLMLFTQYSLLDQVYFCTLCLSIVHFKFTNKIHQLFTDYLLRLPYSELLETHLFRSRANRRLVFFREQTKTWYSWDFVKWRAKFMFIFRWQVHDSRGKIGISPQRSTNFVIEGLKKH